VGAAQSLALDSVVAYLDCVAIVTGKNWKSQCPIAVFSSSNVHIFMLYPVIVALNVLCNLFTHVTIYNTVIIVSVMLQV